MTTFWDEALIAKYNVKGPRYTSYPTALLLRSGYPIERALTALKNAGSALSLYVHLPFCRELCYYCGCNKVISRDTSKADRYLDNLAFEMQTYQAATRHQTVQQLHFGGGTPTFLDETQLLRLMDLLHAHFHFAEDAELSIEIDPRTCSVEKLALLRRLGFSRVSFGVQDFDEQVQQAIHRLQSIEMVETLVVAARRLGFSSVNLDLVYGLPYQHCASFANTLKEVIRLDPDRISLFSYAHLPERFAAQRKIPEQALPDAQEKLALLALSVDTLQQAGFNAIGMDHFAKASDPLTIAQLQQKLTRNFQGYSVDPCDALLGLGVSAISQVGDQIWQQQKDLNDYYRALGQGQLAIDKGLTLSRDDQIRADVIANIMCNFVVDTQAIGQKWHIDFAEYFAQSLESLATCEGDHLVTWQGERLKVTARGRPWVRVISACFDAYLMPQQQNYSKVV